MAAQAAQVAAARFGARGGGAASADAADAHGIPLSGGDPTSAERDAAADDSFARRRRDVAAQAAQAAAARLAAIVNSSELQHVNVSDEARRQTDARAADDRRETLAQRAGGRTDGDANDGSFEQRGGAVAADTARAAGARIAHAAELKPSESGVHSSTVSSLSDGARGPADWPLADTDGDPFAHALDFGVCDMPFPSATSPANPANDDDEHGGPRRDQAGAMLDSAADGAADLARAPRARTAATSEDNAQQAAAGGDDEAAFAREPLRMSTLGVGLAADKDADCDNDLR